MHNRSSIVNSNLALAVNLAELHPFLRGHPLQRVNELLKLLEKVVEARKRPCLFLKLDEIDQIVTPLAIQDELKEAKFGELDVVLQTPGGDPHAAYQIIKLIRRHASKVTIIVPLFAKSAGTLICLGADELLLSEISELGPLDIQIPEHGDGGTRRLESALNRFKALEQVQLHTIQTLDVAMKMIFRRSGLKLSEATHLASEFCGHTSGTLYSQLDPKRIGECALALDVGRQYAKLVLTRLLKWSNDNATKTVEKLVTGYPSHDFVIDFDETTSLSLPSRLVDDAERPLIEELRNFILNSNEPLICLSQVKKPEPAAT